MFNLKQKKLQLAALNQWTTVAGFQTYNFKLLRNISLDVQQVNLPKVCPESQELQGTQTREPYKSKPRDIRHLYRLKSCGEGIKNEFYPAWLWSLSVCACMPVCVCVCGFGRSPRGQKVWNCWRTEKPIYQGAPVWNSVFSSTYQNAST